MNKMFANFTILLWPQQYLAPMIQLICKKISAFSLESRVCFVISIICLWIYNEIIFYWDFVQLLHEISFRFSFFFFICIDCRWRTTKRWKNRRKSRLCVTFHGDIFYSRSSHNCCWMINFHCLFSNSTELMHFVRRRKLKSEHWTRETIVGTFKFNENWKQMKVILIFIGA